MKRPQTILIVEDDDALRRLCRTVLTLAGYLVQEAGDGLEALRRLDHSPPDLVLLDWRLPGISGHVVQQEIAALFARDIPVVIMTGSPEELGHVDVDCILRKPLDPDDLVKTVRTCLLRGAPGAGK
ncbi:MAG TPA: response regulator [Vicinamibacterales bacterium]|nr:response regulator [Vicinamibacterales bacterium]